MVGPCVGEDDTVGAGLKVGLAVVGASVLNCTASDAGSKIAMPTSNFMMEVVIVVSLAKSLQLFD